MTFSLEGGFIPTLIIYLRIFRVLNGGWCWCTKLPPKLPKITLKGSIMRLLILSSVLSIRRASAPTPRWRPSWLKLVMVTTMRQSSSFLKHHTEKMLIQGRYLAMQLSIFRRKKLIQKAQTICKLPATSAADERSFSSARRLKTWLPSRMGDLAVLNGHKRRTDSVYSYTGVCFPQ